MHSATHRRTRCSAFASLVTATVRCSHRITVSDSKTVASERCGACSEYASVDRGAQRQPCGGFTFQPRCTFWVFFTPPGALAASITLASQVLACSATGAGALAAAAQILFAPGWGSSAAADVRRVDAR